jgi:citrate lyase subunit beta/citryl-CoA lyase
MSEQVGRLGRLRSLLFAPAVRPDFLAKLPGRGADAVVIDCEDATPAHAKAEGRNNARSHTAALVDAGCQVLVRVNAEPTAWFLDDVRYGLAPELAAVVVPKVESIASLESIAAALGDAGLGHLGVLAGIETALGVADARTLLAHPVVVGAYFGAEDFIADMGGVRTSSNQEVVVARATVALAGRLAGVPTLDQVVTDFRNDERFADEAAAARAMGYGGKLCIHPSQASIANKAFVPSPAEFDRARRLLAAYDEASAAGVAAIDFEGQMVDEALAAQARTIVALSDD